MVQRYHCCLWRLCPLSSLDKDTNGRFRYCFKKITVRVIVDPRCDCKTTETATVNGQTSLKVLPIVTVDGPGASSATKTFNFIVDEYPFLPSHTPFRNLLKIQTIVLIWLAKWVWQWFFHNLYAWLRYFAVLARRKNLIAWQYWTITLLWRIALWWYGAGIYKQWNVDFQLLLQHFLRERYPDALFIHDDRHSLSASIFSLVNGTPEDSRPASELVKEQGGLSFRFGNLSNPFALTSIGRLTSDNPPEHIRRFFDEKKQHASSGITLESLHEFP